MLSTSQHVNFDSCAILENFCHTFSGSVLNLCRAPWPWRLIKTTFHFQPSTHDLLKLHCRVFLTNAINLTKGRLDAGDCPKMGGIFQKITILINLILKHTMVNHEVWLYSGAPYQETTHCGTTYHNIRSKAPFGSLGTSHGDGRDARCRFFWPFSSCSWLMGFECSGDHGELSCELTPFPKNWGESRVFQLWPVKS